MSDTIYSTKEDHEHLVECYCKLANRIWVLERRNVCLDEAAKEYDEGEADRLAVDTELRKVVNAGKNISGQ